MKIKLIYGSDIRRWHFSQDCQFEALVQFARDAFNFSAPENYNLQFEDDEGDRVTLSCENDLRDALDIAEKEKRKSLKIYVVSAIMDNNSQVLMATQVPELTESLQSEPIALPVKEVSWQECMNDFFANEAVNGQLANFVRQIMKRLRNNCSLKEALMEVLELKEFDVINSHELFTNFVKKNLDCISERAGLLLPTLLIFSDDHIIPIIPQLTETATQMLLGASDVELDITPVFEKLFPDWIAMINANHPDGGQIDLSHIFGTQNASEAAQTMMSSFHNYEQKEEICHNNIICDLCNASPIYGIRYKCAVCPDFDLCSKCEATGVHNQNHALLKFRVPYTGFQRGRMCGIRDMIRNRNIRRGRWFNSHLNTCQFKNPKKHESQKKKTQKVELNQNPTQVEQSSYQEQSESVLCLCGLTMVNSTAECAYKPTKEITCSVCNMKIDKSSKIYHCPKPDHHSHLKGYDICAQCVNIQKNERPNNSEPEPEPEPEPELELEPEIEICKLNQPEEKIVKSQSPVELEPEIEICKLNQLEEKIVKLQSSVEIEQDIEINHADNFPYQEELIHLSEMGFNEKMAKKELIKTNGDLNRAIETLLTF